MLYFNSVVYILEIGIVVVQVMQKLKEGFWIIISNVYGIFLFGQFFVKYGEEDWIIDGENIFMSWNDLFVGKNKFDIVYKRIVKYVFVFFQQCVFIDLLFFF